MLQGGTVEDDVDVLRRAQQPVAVPDVADEEADLGPSSDLLPLVELLGLVAAQDADDGRLGGQQLADEVRADGPGAARDEDAPAADGVELLDDLASSARVWERSGNGSPGGRRARLGYLLTFPPMLQRGR